MRTRCSSSSGRTWRSPTRTPGRSSGRRTPHSAWATLRHGPHSAGSRSPAAEDRRRLGACPVHDARERRRVPDVVQLADPHDDALDAEAEAGVGHAAVAAQVEVPLVVLEVGILLLQPFDEELVLLLADAAADDLAVALGRQEVAA